MINFHTILSVVNIVLSPICFVFFLLVSYANQSIFFESKESNTQKLKIVPYLIYSLLYVLTIVLVTYGLSNIVSEQFTIEELYQPKYYWLSIIGWGITLLTIKTYLKGMEGNIMGFIFFPLLIVSSIALIVVNAPDVYMFVSAIKSPVVEFNFWTRLLLHLFLPFYILLFINSPEEKEKTQRGCFNIIFGSLFFQLVFFGFNWLVAKVFSHGLTFSQFFGEGQTVIYYLPMLGGMCCFIVFLLTNSTFLSNNKWFKSINGMITLLAVLLIVLQLFNYIQLIRTIFLF